MKEQEQNFNQKSEREQRIRKLTKVYYSRQDIQKTIFSFAENREVVPKYFEAFGRRPDSLQYLGDIFELVKKGATSFNCSQELWRDPLKLSTEMSPKELNELRIGWDFLIDIDSKYLDYSKILAEIIIKILRFYGIKNLGLKFSGSRGFHILVPWKSFPEEINNIKTSSMFPEYPRVITKFLIETSKKELIEKITQINSQDVNIKYIKDFQASKEVIPDLILVSPRHLFRMPYSLHEKTALASVVLYPHELKNFQPKDADPLKIQIREFMPKVKEGEATELLREALDWYKNKNLEKPLNVSADSEFEKSQEEFKPIQAQNISEEFLPPTIKKILQGMEDGKKRSLFILLNFFRAIGFDRSEIETRINLWNQRNHPPLKAGYIKSQILWSYRNKITPPPNYEKDYYKGLGITPTEEELRYKNPVNYVVKKYRQKIYEGSEDKPPSKIKNKRSRGYEDD